jgi:molybdopterin molybdotransferase
MLPVFRRPKVVVLSTGTELVEPGSRELSPGEIFDSNSFALLAQAEEAGADVRRVAALSDDEGVLRAAMEEALSTADVVVTSGGRLGGGERPRQGYVGGPRRGADLLGHQAQAGQAGLFRRPRGRAFLRLPGNPVSAMVCFELFVRPALMRMTGREDKHRPRIEVYFDDDVENRFGRMHAMRVTLERTPKGWRAESVGAQGSGLVSLPDESRRPRAHRARIPGRPSRHAGRGDRAARGEAF